jgi:predicted outer membrane repeat protein
MIKTKRFRPIWQALIRLGVLIPLVMLLVGPPSQTQAAGPITVDRNDDTSTASACTVTANDCSLRGAFAFADANPGTTINIPANTYLLTIDELRIGSSTNINTTITGAGPDLTIIQQTRPNTRVINVNPSLAPNVSVSISGLTITGGSNPADGFGGGGVLAGGPNNALALNNCSFTGNSDAGGQNGNPTPLAKGGAVEYSGGGSLTVQNCTFTNNTAANLTTHSGVGGAVDYQLLNTGLAGSLSITYSRFSGNTAASTGNGAGGAIRVVDTTNSQPRSVTINSNIFTGNRATDPGNTGGGGAIASTGKNPITVRFNSFLGNTATGGGSAIYQATGTLGTIDATLNWWGCNTGPGTLGCDGIGGLTANITTIPFLVLDHKIYLPVTMR